MLITVSMTGLRSASLVEVDTTRQSTVVSRHCQAITMGLLTTHSRRGRPLSRSALRHPETTVTAVNEVVDESRRRVNSLRAIYIAAGRVTASMTPRIPTRIDDRQRDHRPVRTRLEDATTRLERAESQLQEMTARLDQVESRLQLLDRTVHAVARQSGISVGGPCNRCERSCLLIADGMMQCPTCGYQRSI